MRQAISSFRADLLARPVVAFAGRGPVLAAGLALLAALLVFKNINLVSPIMGWDEYVYFSQSREFPNLANLLTYDSTGAKTYNIVYFAIGRILWNNASDPALTMRALQALIYVLNFPVFYLLCRRFMSRKASVAVTVLGLISGYSAFSAYFMPETLYAFLFFSLLACMVWFKDFPVPGAFGSGILVALLTLTKPHGIAIALGVAFTWILCIAFPRLVGIARARSALALLWFGVAFYVALVTINVALTGRLRLHPLLFVGDLYAGFWTAKSRAMAPVLDLLTVIAGNAGALALLIGFPFVYAALFLAQQISSREARPDPERERYWFFAIATFCLSMMLLGMTVNFTAQVGGEEVWRAHGRYYSFIVPLFLLLMFAAAGQQQIPKTEPPALLVRAAALAGLALMAVIQFSWRTAYSPAPWDFPELFSLSTWEWTAGSIQLGTNVLILGAAVFAAIVVWPSRAPVLFACFFLVLNVASLAQTTRWQFAHMRSFAPYTDTAAAIRLLLSPENLDRGVVIGNTTFAPYSVVALRSKSRVLMVAPNSIVDTSTVGAAPWALIAGPLDVRLDRAKLVLQRGDVMFFVLQDLPPFTKKPGAAP